MRIIIGHIELTKIDERLWIFDRREGIGRFLSVGEIEELLSRQGTAGKGTQS